MAIVEYFEEGVALYRVRVVKKSKVIFGLDATKKKKGIKTRKQAERVEKLLSQQAAELLSTKEQRGSKWCALRLDWHEAVVQGDIFAKQIDSGTLHDYSRLLERITKSWDKLSALEIDRALVWEALASLEAKESRERARKLRAAINAVFTWGMRSGRIKGISHTPTEGYESLKKKLDALPEILTKEEMAKLLYEAKRLESPWYPVWALALYTGMRSGELYALQWDCVDLEDNVIYVHRNWTSKKGFGPTKGRYWRTVPIDSTEVIEFFKTLRLNAESEFVLPRLREWGKGEQARELRKFCQSIGITSVKFHTLRACFATHLLRAGVSTADVMKICGWKDLDTMQRYVRLAGINTKGATSSISILQSDKITPISDSIITRRNPA